MINFTFYDTVNRMIFLLAFILPAAFLLYSVFSKDVSGTFTAFLIGLAAGLASLIAVSFLPIENLAVSASFLVQTLRIFLQYFLSNAVIGLFFFFLVSRSVSGEAVDTSFSALFGIFTVVFVHMLYRHLADPGRMDFILFLLIIIGAVLIFDSAFNMMAASSAGPLDFAVYAVAFIPFALVCLLGSAALSSWYFNGNPVFYLGTSAGICAVGVILNAVVSRL